MGKKSVTEQVQENYPEFADEVNTLSTEQMNDRLATFAKHREEVQDTKDADEGLQEAREKAKELAAPYIDAQKAIRLKSKFIIGILKDRGAK